MRLRRCFWLYLAANRSRAGDSFRIGWMGGGSQGPNGMADVLDEARWGLDWMLKMHPEPDALYHQVADDRDHIGLRLPQDETADYGWGPGWRVSSTLRTGSLRV